MTPTCMASILNGGRVKVEVFFPSGMTFSAAAEWMLARSLRWAVKGPLRLEGVVWLELRREFYADGHSPAGGALARLVGKGVLC